MGPGHLHEEALENTLPGGGVIGDIFIPMICGSLAAEQRRHQLLRVGLRGCRLIRGYAPPSGTRAVTWGRQRGRSAFHPLGSTFPDIIWCSPVRSPRRKLDASCAPPDPLSYSPP